MTGVATALGRGSGRRCCLRLPWQILGTQAEIDLVLTGFDVPFERTLVVVDRAEQFASLLVGLGNRDPIRPDRCADPLFGEGHFVVSQRVADPLGHALAISLEHQLGTSDRVAIEQDQPANFSEFGHTACSLRRTEVKADRVGTFADGGREDGLLVVEFRQRFIVGVLGVVAEESDGDSVLAHRSAFQLGVEFEFVATVLVGSGRADTGDVIVEVDLCAGEWYAVESDPADDVSERSAAGRLEPGGFGPVATGQDRQQNHRRQVEQQAGQSSSHRSGSPHISAHGSSRPPRPLRGVWDLSAIVRWNELAGLGKTAGSRWRLKSR